MSGVTGQREEAAQAQGQWMRSQLGNKGWTRVGAQGRCQGHDGSGPNCEGRMHQRLGLGRWGPRLVQAQKEWPSASRKQGPGLILGWRELQSLGSGQRAPGKGSPTYPLPARAQFSFCVDATNYVASPGAVQW